MSRQNEDSVNEIEEMWENTEKEARLSNWGTIFSQKKEQIQPQCFDLDWENGKIT